MMDPRLIAAAIILSVTHGMAYNFGSTGKELDCVDDKLEVEKEKVDGLKTSIQEHTEDAISISQHNEKVDKSVTESGDKLVEAKDIPLDPSVCSGPSIIRLLEEARSTAPPDLYE